MIKRLQVLVEKPKLTKTRISRCFKMCQWLLTHHHRMLKHKATLNHTLQPAKRWDLKTGDISCWAHWACKITSMVLILRSLFQFPSLPSWVLSIKWAVCEWSPSEQAHSREYSVNKSMWAGEELQGTRHTNSFTASTRSPTVTSQPRWQWTLTNLLLQAPSLILWVPGTANPSWRDAVKQ